MKSWEERLNEAMAEKGYSDRSEFGLEELLELARSHEITPSEREEQRISFAYSMLPFSNTITTREDIERMAKGNPLPYLRVVK